MNPTEAQTLLDRAAAGEFVGIVALQQALDLEIARLDAAYACHYEGADAWPSPRERVGFGPLPPAPPGTEWHRPAPGWVDLRKVPT
jgi:hypothetical protein